MDNVVLLTIIAFLLLFILLLLGQKVAFALATAGILLLHFFVGKGQLAMIGRLQFNMSNSFTLGCIPFFIFMGYMLINSGLSAKLYNAVAPAVSFIPGGLLHTNVVGGAILGATSGSTLAGVSAVGAIALPELKKRGYDKKLTYGSVAAGGSMSAIIPPSVSFIVYGSIVGESIGALFVAGIIPGILMTLLFMFYIVARAIKDPSVAPKEKVARQELLHGFLSISPVVLLILTVLGSIYFGIATPTEASAVGAAMSVLISIGYKSFNWDILKRTTADTVRTSCMVLILVVGAQFFSMGISLLRIPTRLTTWVLALQLSPLTVFSFIVMFYIVLGMFMEATPIQLMTLPLTYPIMMSLGYDSIWFGVIITILTQVGCMTPPVGMDVFIVHKLSGEKDITPAFMGAMPFTLIMGLVIIIITIFPGLVTWLPSRMM